MEVVRRPGAALQAASWEFLRGRAVFSLTLGKLQLRQRVAALLSAMTQSLPPRRELLKALTAGVAYYVGAELAFWVGTLSYFFAPLWPPNMILFCALLMAPYRRWWLYVAAALPAHIAAETQVGMEAPAMMGAFACNLALALSGAAGLRRLSQGPPWLDTLAKAWMFILVSAVAAPAGVALSVALLGWVTRDALGSVDFAMRWGLANVLGGVALAPLLVTWIGEGTGWLKRVSVRRAAEAVALAVALVVSAYVGFPAASAQYPVLACVPIPLMLWAAVRFGPRGAAGAIFVMTLMALGAALAGRAPFEASSPEHTIFSLQTFLAVLSAPFLVLAAVVAERRRATTEVQDLSARLLNAQDEERRRIARELHDSTGQNLTAALLNLRGVEESGALHDKERIAVEESGRILDEVHAEIRTLSYLLHPPLLDEVGLAPALRWYVDGFIKRSGIAVQLQVSPDLGRLERDAELALFRVVQESLSNVYRHSGSKTASIDLTRSPEGLVLTISDAGRGMAGDAIAGRRDQPLGVGVAGMKARLKQLGGRLEIHSSAGGTTVRAILPPTRPAGSAAPPP
jgi:signal transduction histidine kinase